LEERPSSRRVCSESDFVRQLQLTILYWLRSTSVHKITSIVFPYNTYRCVSALQLSQSRFSKISADSGCAGYLGHLFTKSKGCAKTMALISHFACTKRCTYQETQEQASSFSIDIYAPTFQPSREITYSLRLWKETQKHPITLTRLFGSAEWASSVPRKHICQG
jgi:hypothetical protein